MGMSKHLKFGGIPICYKKTIFAIIFITTVRHFCYYNLYSQSTQNLKGNSIVESCKQAFI